MPHRTMRRCRSLSEAKGSFMVGSRLCAHAPGMLHKLCSTSVASDLSLVIHSSSRRYEETGVGPGLQAHQSYMHACGCPMSLRLKPSGLQTCLHL